MVKAVWVVARGLPGSIAFKEAWFLLVDIIQLFSSVPFDDVVAIIENYIPIVALVSGCFDEQITSGIGSILVQLSGSHFCHVITPFCRAVFVS